MTRLKKELIERGILYDDLDNENSMNTYESGTSLVCAENGCLVVVRYSNVLDDEFVIYDARTLEVIGSQERYKDSMSFVGTEKRNPWLAWMNIPENDYLIDTTEA